VIAPQAGLTALARASVVGASTVPTGPLMPLTLPRRQDRVQQARAPKQQQHAQVAPKARMSGRSPSSARPPRTPPFASTGAGGRQVQLEVEQRVSTAGGDGMTTLPLRDVALFVDPVGPGHPPRPP